MTPVTKYSSKIKKVEFSRSPYALSRAMTLKNFRITLRINPRWRKLKNKNLKMINHHPRNYYSKIVISTLTVAVWMVSNRLLLPTVNMLPLGCLIRIRIRNRLWHPPTLMSTMMKKMRRGRIMILGILIMIRISSNKSNNPTSKTSSMKRNSTC